jgi:hypothetical protein
MNIEQIEARLKSLEEQNKAVHNENKELQKKVTTLEDIEAIRKLEAAYGYFIEHLLYEEIGDCWAENGVMEWLGLGRFVGRDTIKKQWQATAEGFHKRGQGLHPGPRYCGYITINPDGKTAAGRWYVAGSHNGMEMLCENRYIKENGVWKYSLLSVGGFPMDMSTMGAPSATSAMGPGAGSPSAGGPGPGAPPAGGPGPGMPLSEAQKEKFSQEYMGHYNFTERISRCPRQEYGWYLRPFSFKHPVTGKDVNISVEAHNKKYPCPMPPGGENWTAKK